MAKKVFTSDSWNEFTAGITSLKTKTDNTNIAYGTCSTDAATAAKVITVSGNTQWELTAGSTIIVKFSYTNSASNPTFNVNGTGAKSIWYNTALITTSSSTLSYAGYANRPMIFTYDGTQYVFMGWAYDSNTDTKVQQNAAITTAGEYPVILAYNTSTSKQTNAVNKTSTLKYNPSTQVLTAPTFKGNLDGNAATATSANTATSATSATKATQDASGNVITSTYETKTDASSKLDEAKEYTDTVASGKADSSHTHSISNVTNLQSSLDAKVPTSRTVNGKALSGNITLSASDVGAAESGHTHSSYVNQNAFSNVKVGSTTVAADTTTDTLEIAAGTGISVSGDATNDKVTITNSGVRSISTGSANGTISVNTNGSSANVAVKGLGSAAYTASTAYDAAGTAQTKADSALASAKSYTDTAISNLINSAPTTLDTLGEIATAMAENEDVVSALEDAIGTKANEGHGHAISDVSGLQSALDGKAASSHGTHVSYSSTAPVMDGTASVGSASTVARSDHKHPTDTSRASKTEFDTHVADTTKHITSTERTNWGTAYTHSQAAHAPSNAQANQNAFSNIKVGTTTIAADTTTDTLELVGSNVTITPDATNDKVTISVASGSTSTAGILKLTNSTSSTSTTTAATPSSVKSAYDLANQAKTAATNAQTTADGKANASHTHTKSEITDFPTIPTKTSQLTNDSGFKTTDTNTTYDFSASTNSVNGNVNLKLVGNNNTTDSVIITGTGGTTVTTDSTGIVTVNSNKITMKTWSSSDMV